MFTQVPPNDARGATVTTLLATTTSLTAADRCDRCGAQAYVRVVLTGGADLLFCEVRITARKEKRIDYMDKRIKSRT